MLPPERPLKVSKRGLRLPKQDSRHQDSSIAAKDHSQVNRGWSVAGGSDAGMPYSPMASGARGILPNQELGSAELPVPSPTLAGLEAQPGFLQTGWRDQLSPTSTDGRMTSAID